MSGRSSRSGLAANGSRFCLQRYVNERPQELAAMIGLGGESFQWVSPVAGNEYREHRDDFLSVLGLSQHQVALQSFWPGNGPQWDGLAKAGSSVILIEAKAHPGETRSSCKATAPKSLGRIHAALEEVRTYMGAESGELTERKWTKDAYQLANRLAFLYFLHVKRGIPTYLVLINFVDDASYRPTSLAEWHRFPYTGYLGLQTAQKLLDRVITIYPNAL